MAPVSTDARSTGATSPDATGKARRWTILVAFMFVCLNLRIVFGGVGPLLPYLHLGPATAGALTAFPPLCMGLFAPLGAMMASRFGEERALFLAILILTIGVLIRSCGISGLLGGTIVCSVGVAALNVLTPVFVRQNFAAPRIGAMMGIYAMMMGVGGGFMAALVVPFYHAAGNSWSIALGTAAVPAVLALVALIPLLGASSRPNPAATVSRRWHWLLTHPSAWSLIGFFGIQSLVFYTMLSWLPAIFVARGVPAAHGGLYLAISILAVAIGGFCGPTLAARRSDHRRDILAIVAICVIGLLGILLTPVSLGLFWSFVLGLGMGAGQGVPSVLYAKRTADRHQMTQLSGMVQAFGYLIAATGPVAASALRAHTGGWTSTLVVLLVLLIANGIIGLRGGSDHIIADR